MDTSSPFWFSELVAAALGVQVQPSLSSESCTTCTSFNLVGNATSLNGSSMDASPTSSSKKPKRVEKTNSWSTEISLSSAPNSMSQDSPSTYPLQSFGEIAGAAVKPEAESHPYLPFSFGNIAAGGVVKPGSKRSFEAMAGEGWKVNNMAIRPAYVQEHVIAERKRREKLSRRFIELSAIIPGLKKIDKASVLGDAIKYLKQLQEKVKNLEEKKVKRIAESTLLVRKPSTSIDDSNSSSKEDFEERPFEKPFSEIEVMLSGNSALLKIHCENRKGMLVKVLFEIEKLHLSITNSDSMLFTESSLYVNVIAKFDEGFSMTVKEVVQKLSSVLE